MRIFCAIQLILFLTVTSLSAEARTWREIFNTAIFFFDEKEYAEALYNYKLLYEKDSTNADVNFRIGMCYMFLPGEEIKAVPYLERATKKIDVNHREHSINNEGAPLHALFFLGKAYRLAGKLDKAMEIIEDFQSSPYFLQYNPRVVGREINTIQRAKALQDNPLNVSYTRFSKSIPDKTPALHPVISGDGKTLVYLAQFSFYDAIMVSEKIGDTWETPVNISSQIQSDGNSYPVSLSYNGQELYLINEISAERSDLYVSVQTENGWSVATPLSINSRKKETGAGISPDGKTLYISSNRGFGSELNIYVSTRKALTDEWSRPSNVRKSINTDLDETFPQLTPDEKYLFFSSHGHYNMGEYDIFFVEKKEDGDWSNPVNIGYPINTTNDNLYYFPINRYIGLMSLQRESDDVPVIYKITINR